MTSPDIPSTNVERLLPGGAPDQETADLMHDLDRMQTWATVLMTRQTPGSREAYDLIQRTRVYIVERQYPRARNHLKEQTNG